MRLIEAAIDHRPFTAPKVPERVEVANMGMDCWIGERERDPFCPFHEVFARVPPTQNAEPTR
ncbi:hypothetical protein MesoLj131c_31110 [Mesorhizobium sp. 131-3-5]|nr:hypothetical protein MesoLj131c_31110 [Mesorhizobium sp. 131-3-5]